MLYCTAYVPARAPCPAVLDRELGVEAAGDISFEVSSPGAERIVLLPAELKRFAGLPLRVGDGLPACCACLPACIKACINA